MEDSNNTRHEIIRAACSCGSSIFGDGEVLWEWLLLHAACLQDTSAYESVEISGGEKAEEF